MHDNKADNFYRSQAQKRLRLVYEYARDDLEKGRHVEVYYLCAEIAGVEVSKMFSGPERNVWHDIRLWSHHLRFYPEYAIGDDTVDFCAPYRRIVIEVDSRLHNADTDAAKTARLIKQGYIVHRVHQKNATANLDEFLEQIAKLEEFGKSNIAAKMRAEIPLKSESIIQNISNSFRPATALNDRDMTRTVTMAEVASTKEFKEYWAKYCADDSVELNALKETVRQIPLYR